ncbi:hypothetical protein [Paenarthrobacter ureafaciens]|uniref:hypothetical protein n=1 Tax=Paenarthrobacter ureafaciens TaxID=37931 RepID=UPI0009AC9491|nr:hypothetical protein [Paenarthrobacter ureafaciens]GLU60477.1 hypothetical protein Pure01_29900 [Paenarthrobacter ureafaciens]GLU64795.1 hypothetical protein Pure02_30450 [Paenarthrobacter ureafaciens]GLU69074.1 hypothetical protein Pure03_30500 [Paenarthrobacter ureafaciens]GLU73284.1 hypothetical protein Pure04_29990 [Paenarthrobacter ureafaciens]GLU77597.1 hypothetical protein Pure05_30370 [Paenarthrobacter ureafaciens]
MNNHPQRQRPEASVDRFLADSGVDDAADIRTELLELRSLAATNPAPSDAVRALMTGSAGAQETTTAVLTAVDTSPDASAAAATEPGTTPRPAVRDELALRRRKRRAAFTGLAVAVSLAGGATAAAAQEGGIAGTFQHWGAAIGSVVDQFAPAQAPAEAPHEEEPAGVPVQDSHSPQPASGVPGESAGTVPGGGATPPAAPSSGPGKPNGNEQAKEPARPAVPGNALPLPAPPVSPENLPKLDPPKVEPSDIPVPVPTHVVPEIPKAPANSAK